MQYEDVYLNYLITSGANSNLVGWLPSEHCIRPQTACGVHVGGLHACSRLLFKLQINSR